MSSQADNNRDDPGQDARGPLPHWRALAVITLAVLAAHAWVTYEVAQEMKTLAPAEPAIQRMEATYVSEVKLTAPPVAPTAAPALEPAAGKAPLKKRRKVRAPDKAASAPPEDAASAPMAEEVASTVVAEVKPEEPAPAASAPSQSLAAASAPAEAASKPGEVATFVWPKATRVSYKLEGDYRGPCYGCRVCLSLDDQGP